MTLIINTDAKKSKALIEAVTNAVHDAVVAGLKSAFAELEEPGDKVVNNGSPSSKGGLFKAPSESAAAGKGGLFKAPSEG